jgi:hypothetical protein
MKQQHKFNWRSLVGLLTGLVLGLAVYTGHTGIVPPVAAAGPDKSVGYVGDLPIAADAQTFSYNVASKQLDYTSPSTVESLATFYRQTLLAQGWQENRYLSTYGNGLALVRFTQGESSPSVHISNSGSSAATEVTLLTHCVMWSGSLASAFYAANPELMVAHRSTASEILTLDAFLEANPELRFARNRLAVGVEESTDSAFLAANPELMVAHRYAVID